MPSEMILELLTKQSATRLREMRDGLRSEIARLQFEAEYVERALEAKQSKKKAANPASGAAEGDDDERLNGRSNKREPILEIARTDPARVWMPSDVRDELAQRGISTTPDAIRVTMRRMLLEGLFVRGPKHQGFILAAEHGGPDQPDLSSNGGSEPPSMATHPQEGDQE
jgi:hypothetical protein